MRGRVPSPIPQLSASVLSQMWSKVRLPTREWLKSGIRPREWLCVLYHFALDCSDRAVVEFLWIPQAMSPNQVFLLGSSPLSMIAR